MDQACDRARGSRPSTARVQVWEVSWQGRHNPCPQSKDPGSHDGGSRSEQLVQEHLSPARLALAQVRDLRLVSALELCVDTRETSLGNFGLHLPSLSQLKLNGSRLGSVRDLGTSLCRLQVLWLTRCGLADLDGISSLPALKELYASYNRISDLSPLCLLEALEVLDLEGNSVEDLGQVCYLQLCPRLATLTLEGNLVCLRPRPIPSNKVPQGYNYRAEVSKLIPQLQMLDEVPASHTKPPASQKLDQDWLMVKEAIKEGRVLDGLLPGLDCPYRDPVWRHSPEPSPPETQPRAPRAWPLSLLAPGSPLPTYLLPKDLAPEDDSSSLTHGAGRVLCGNPTKGLRERQHRCQAWAPPGPHPPEDLAAIAPPPGPDPADVRGLAAALAALQSWREPCPWRLLSWQEGAQAPRSPQRGHEEPEDEMGPGTSPSPPSLAPGGHRGHTAWSAVRQSLRPRSAATGLPGEQDPVTQSQGPGLVASAIREPSGASGCNLLPSPPKLPAPSGSSSSWGSTELQFRGRRLRALGSPGSGLGQELAALRALGAAPGPKPAADPTARTPALRRLPHLNPISPTQTHP